MGLFDIELYKKVRGTNQWIKVKLPDDLPEIELDIFQKYESNLLIRFQPSTGPTGSSYV